MTFKQLAPTDGKLGRWEAIDSDGAQRALLDELPNGQIKITYRFRKDAAEEGTTERIVRNIDVAEQRVIMMDKYL